MLIRLARAYVYLILVIDLLFLAASVLLFIAVLTRTMNQLLERSEVLLIGALFTPFPAFGLARERNVWKNELRDCPWWLRAIAIVAFLFSILVILTAIIQSRDGTSLLDGRVVFIALEISFNLMSLCIIHSVLSSGALSKAEFLKRVRTSVILLAAWVAIFAIGSALDVARFAH